jgi:hypothetical protein
MSAKTPTTVIEERGSTSRTVAATIPTTPRPTLTPPKTWPKARDLSMATPRAIRPIGSRTSPTMLCQWSRHRRGVNPISRVSRKPRAVQPRLFSAVLSSIRKPRQVSGCGFVHRSHRNYYTNHYTVSVPPATQAKYPSGLITASGLANVCRTRLMGSRPPRSPRLLAPRARPQTGPGAPEAHRRPAGELHR